MTGNAGRLQRFATLHGDLVRLLDLRLAGLRARIEELDRGKAALMQAVERMATSGVMSHSAAAQRLLELETARTHCKQALDELLHKKTIAGIRCDFFARRASELTVLHERKMMETESREIALQMKATGKNLVMK